MAAADDELPFERLDAEVPLLLLPLRLETCYRLDADPPELRIRVYPDQVHVDADTPAPGRVEAKLTRQFWLDWHTATSERARQAAWRTFARRIGTQRAGWLARTLRPQVDGSGRLRFPAVPDGPPRMPAWAALLPGQWLAVGYAADSATLFRQVGRPIARRLRTGPDPSAAPVEINGSGLVIDDGLAWMVDYDRAVDVGMAVTVRLTGAAAAAAHGVATLLVVGVDAGLDPLEAATELDRLLGVHARTSGVAFVPQGTPTNNTDTVTSGWSAQERATADLAARELTDPRPVPHDNASRLAEALGLADATTLRHAAFGTDPERERSRAMVRVLFEAVLGTYARKLLRIGGDTDVDGLAPTTVAALRDWCIRWVTGGAPLPTVAIGPQPYGVLPVRRSAGGTETTGIAGTARNVEAVVKLLAAEWRRAAASAPVLDPDLGDTLPDGEAATRLATILAALPHPARIFLRWAERYSADDILDQLSPQGWWQLFLETFDPDLNPAYGSPLVEIGALYAGATIHAPVATADDQLAAWEGVREAFPAFLAAHPPAGADDNELARLTRDGLDLLDAVVSVLTGWKARQQPLADLGLDAFAGVLAEDDTELVAAILSADADEWDDVGVVEKPAAGPGRTAADYLADLRDRVAAAGTELPPSGLDEGFLASQPLLYQLLDATLDRTPDDADEVAAVIDALDLLASRSANELEWLLRETLGLGTHRLDAWATSLAAERLQQIRSARPTGVHIGAFGWVTGLAPARRGRSSDGFVHAPSMAHATTAAVLRSGWLAQGGTGPLAPAAVDVRSHRVRAATWLLDGVRQGQDLGDLLGYRFERALHDLSADEQIRPVRLRVLRASGRPDVPPDEPVDGVALLDLHRSGALDDVPTAVRDALEELETAFDAVGDVGLFEAVHQLTGGNLERATAVLDALATGTITPPELLAPTTPRAVIPVEHRVLLLLHEAPPHPGRGWAVDGVRTALAPALDAWVAALLPDGASVGFAVTRADGAAPETSLTLDALGLSALDALWLVGDDPDRVSSAVTTLAADVVGGEVTIDPAAGVATDGVVTLREFTALAVELRRALDGLRVADAADLRRGDAQVPDPANADDGTAVDPALDAVADLVSSFDRLVDDLDDAIEVGTAAAVAPAARQMARIGLATGAAPGDVAAASELHALAVRRLGRVAAVEVDAGDRLPGLEARAAALLGGRVPLLRSFEAGDGMVDVTDPPAGADADAVDDWLDVAARVRPDLGRVVAAGMLSEVLDPAAGLRATAGQLPADPVEPWAATSRPTGRGGRLSVVALTGPGGPPGPGTSACGLVVDRWSEQIPADTQVTGVTFHFDAPGNRPPQAWLLAVPPEGEGWNLALVLDTLLETLEWATLRAVAPEDLLAWGRALPTLFVPGSVHPWPAATNGEGS